MLNFGNKEFRNLQEQVLKNAQDIQFLKEKPGFKPVVVDELPEVGEEGILYLVPKNPDPDTGDADSFDEYVWLTESETYEFVGSTVLDLQHLPSPIYITTENKPEGLSYGLRITNNGWTSDLQQEGGAKLELTGTAVNVTGDLTTSGKIQVGASGYNIKKDSTNLVIEADGNPVKVRGTLLPNTGGTYDLGNVSTKWNGVYLNQLNFGDNSNITKDSSNRLNLNAGGSTRIKVGTIDSTYCVANWTPDQDATYNLGTSTMRWSVVNATKVTNDYSSLTLKGNSNITCDGYVVPANNHQYTLGNSNYSWLNVFADDITCPTIVKKPNYATPDVWASGKLASGTGSATIDYTDETGVGLPDWGLYMFTYGNAQCYVAFTYSMWLRMLAGYPIRVACPCLEEAGGQVEGNTGNLKIEKTSTTGVIKITVASTVTGSATSTNGWDFQFIKVM